MKQLIKNLALLVLPLLVIFIMLLVQPKNSEAAGVNLIANQSVETVSGTLPQNWVQDKWGTNSATFTYPTTGQSGSRSVQVQLKSYTSGDAKWAFKSVIVTPNTSYTYSDYYISTVQSQLVAEVGDQSGNLSYFDIGTLAKSTAWKNASFTFTTPANAKTITVYHLINRIGTLQTDNFSLVSNAISTSTPTPTATASPTPSPTASPTATPTPSATPTPTASPTPTPTASPTPSASPSPTVSPTASPTPAPTATPSPTATPTPTASPTPVPTVTPTPTPSATSIPTATPTPTPSASPTASPTPTPTPSATPVPTASPTPQPTMTPTPTATPTASPTPSPTPQPISNIANSSVEQALSDPQTPDNWARGNWGTNTPIFTYLNNLGHSGTHSVKTEITSYTSGDAKWYFTPIAVTSGQHISFSDYYESNITSRVVVEFTHADQSKEYLELKNAPASANWANYFDNFTVPANTQSMTVFHIISAVGFLTVDDYSSTAFTSSGFARPMVSLTFDDGLVSQYTTGLPTLQKYGFLGTFYIITGDLNTDGYMTTAMVQSLKDSGQEITSHTITHPHLSQLTDAQMDHELKDSQIYLQTNFGVTANNFAPPYGDNDGRISDAVATYYSSLRGVLSGYNDRSNIQLMNLLVQNVTIDTPPSQIQVWVNQAQATNSWLILVYHPDDNTSDPYGVTPENFDTEMNEIKQSGVTVLTVNQAINEIIPQL